MYNEYNQSGLGVYTAGSQFDLDPAMLQSIGFTLQEIQVLNYIVTNEGTATTSLMRQKYGIPYDEAQKLKYMYDICTGRVVINSEDDLAKHLRKLFGRHRRLGIGDLETSKVADVPRVALVGGIPEDTPFAIWNSKQYDLNDRAYRVVGVTSDNIIIETDRLPVLRYKEPKYIENMLEIKTGVNQYKKIEVAINKKYCKLCNRFVIVASMRRPEFHHGMVEMICIEGTRVYVFADTVEGKKYSRYGTAQRIYDFGYYPSEIKVKLMASASDVYKRLCGVYATTIAANCDFNVLASEEKEQDKEELVVE